MFLILDFGNTFQKMALFRDGKMVHFESHSKLALKQLREIIKKFPGITASILSSVIRHPLDIVRYLQDNFFFIELTDRTPVPIRNLYQSAETLGKDRLAAAVGGWSLFPGEPVLVINAGTCITYDFINASAEYLGGSISPGMNMRFRALHTFTKQLPLLTYTEIDFLTGNDTDQSVLSGVINGMAAEMEGMIVHYQKEYPGIKVVLSGGDLNYFVNRLKISIFALPNIVIYGLQQILAFNDKNPL